MQLLLSDPPETKNTVHPIPASERHRTIAPSRSGRRYVVLEVHANRLGPGDAEWDWEIYALEVSGWLCKVRAEALRDCLEREGRWLDEASRERMRAGETLSLGELQWDRS